jgi:hypothetical protein
MFIGRGVAAAFCVATGVSALSSGASAYTAAGDRVFPATIVLPQNSPSDDLYLTTSTQPLHSATLPGSSDRLTNGSFTYDKTITERFSVGFTEGYNRFDQAGGAGTASGWQNLETMFQYLAVLDPAHELLISVGGAREWGGTGALSTGASPTGATTGAVYFGKGMGDLGISALRPFAITGQLGYQFADQNSRADLLVTGIAVEYSIPYLVSKVSSVQLPDVLRAMTPMVEFQFNTPSSNPRGTTSSGLIAPGINYAGEGWELGVEALIPTTRSAGSGIGFTAQLHFALDYLFPETLGRPLFSRH